MWRCYVVIILRIGTHTKFYFIIYIVCLNFARVFKIAAVVYPRLMLSIFDLGHLLARRKIKRTY